MRILVGWVERSEAHRKVLTRDLVSEPFGGLRSAQPTLHFWTLSPLEPQFVFRRKNGTRFAIPGTRPVQGEHYVEAMDPHHRGFAFGGRDRLRTPVRSESERSRSERRSERQQGGRQTSRRRSESQQVTQELPFLL